jgi:predicted dehydrogenase
MHHRVSASRRHFLQTMLAAGVAPLVVPARVLGGENAPSKKIQLGHIGTGGQGTSDLRNFLGVAGAASVALCDPYQERRERAAKFVQEQQGHAPKLYGDFRELLADPGIDAVVIATPDHWHVPVALAAVRAGKDVYVEKPLGYSLEQNRLIRDAVKQSGRVFQYGTQQRSQELMKRGVELVRNGYLGEIQRIEVWAPAGRGGGSHAKIPVPAGLDYDLYLGPAPLRPCAKERITSVATWHCADYALGFIAGWGAHPLDIAIWGMRSDLKGPLRAKGTGTFPPATDLFNACKSWDVDLRFADGVEMKFQSSDIATPHVETYRTKIVRGTDGAKQVPGDGTTFYGPKGWVSLSRAASEASNPEWLRLKEGAGTDRVVYRNHYYSAFVESVRSRGHLIAPIEDAVRSDTLSHVALAAIQSGQEVVWDPAAYRYTSPASLNSILAKPMRGNWLGPV